MKRPTKNYGDQRSTNLRGPAKQACPWRFFALNAVFWMRAKWGEEKQGRVRGLKEGGNLLSSPLLSSPLLLSFFRSCPNFRAVKQGKTNKRKRWLERTISSLASSQRRKQQGRDLCSRDFYFILCLWIEKN